MQFDRKLLRGEIFPVDESVVVRLIRRVRRDEAGETETERMREREREREKGLTRKRGRMTMWDRETKKREDGGARIIADPTISRGEDGWMDVNAIV